MIDDNDISTDRRAFLGRVAAGTVALAAVGIGVAGAQGQGGATGGQGATGAQGRSGATGGTGTKPAVAVPTTPTVDQWLDGIKGVHKQFFDAVSTNDGASLAFAMNFMDTNKAAYALKDDALTAIVGLRHFAIPIAFNDKIWAKYKLGEFFKITDAKTKAPSVRNLWFHPAPKELMFDGQAYDKLQGRGVIFTVCNVALTVLSGIVADAAKVPKASARDEWIANMLPGATVVPSGVLAANRAQEKGCTYCYAG
jgi:intracellular sulfur oxidation DsrE/DsrF family protein